MSTTVETEAWTRKGEFLRGARQMIPFLVAAFPMGVIGGVFGLASGLDAWQTLAMAGLLNSGTAQLVGMKLLQIGAQWWVILLTTVILSLRMLIYSTLLRPQVRDFSPKWRLLLGFGLIDAVFFVLVEAFRKDKAGPARRWFFLGTSVPMFVNWMGATVIGMVVGQALPGNVQLSMDFLMTAAFIVVLASTLVNWKVWTAVATAGVLIVLTYDLPYSLGLFVSGVGGALAGMACEYVERRRGPAAGDDPGGAEDRPGEPGTTPAGDRRPEEVPA
ncbi:MAG TPA: AzlC family ABC transporter permease [Pseudonocardiaceae bacterium]